MKKSILLALALIGGVVANAATVNWTVSGVYQPGTTTAGSGYAVYLFQASNSVTTTALATAIESGSFLTDYSNVVLKSASTGATGAALATGIGNYSGSTESPTVVSFITVVFDSASYDATYAANGMYAIGESADVTFTSATGAKAAAFTNFSTNNAWQAVPEPTSGMLLLVGCALMALKRKRA